MTFELPGASQLFVLAIDHRVDLCMELLGCLAEQPGAGDRERAADLNRVVFEGLAQAIEEGVPKSQAAIWVDPDLGEAVQLRARAMALATAVSIGQPARDTFRIEAGTKWIKDLARFGASYAGARVAYRTAMTREEREALLSTLRMLSEACRANDQSLMLELVMRPSEADLRAHGGAEDWHRDVGPLVTVEAMRELQDSGVEPSAWVVEPPEDARAAATVAAQAHVDDRIGVSVIFALGNDPGSQDPGADLEPAFRNAVQLAARTPGVTGLLAGPAFYFRQLALYNSEQMSRADAVAEIASRFRTICDEFSTARHTSDVM